MYELAIIITFIIIITELTTFLEHSDFQSLIPESSWEKW